MTLSRTHFISEPVDKRYRGGLYEFKRDNPSDNMTYYCNGDRAEVRKIVNAILDRVTDQGLLNLIYKYGEAITEEVRGDWYENAAEESL